MKHWLDGCKIHYRFYNGASGKNIHSFMQLRELTGKRLGQYQLLGLLGEGGMSAVYRAYQENLEREVAIKVLSEHLSHDPSYKQRFVLEAKTAAGLEHANIVPVYDYGTQDGISYVVMRYLSGGTLSQRITHRYSRQEFPSSLGEAQSLLQAVAEALDYAHSRGVIHRDIKPSNVMFDSQGQAYIVDFGIARLVNVNLSLTSEDITFGTPTYMSPEQWRNDEITPLVDQYAMGVLMYNLLTGHLPFDAETPNGMMYKHLHEDVPAPHMIRKAIPETVAPVLMKAMAKTGGERYKNVRVFSKAFTIAIAEHRGESTNFFTFALPETQNDEGSARHQTGVTMRIQQNDSGDGIGVVTILNPADEMDALQPIAAVVPQSSYSHPIETISYDLKTPPPNPVVMQREGQKRRSTLLQVLLGGGIGLLVLLVLVAIIFLVVVPNLGGAADDSSATPQIENPKLTAVNQSPLGAETGDFSSNDVDAIADSSTPQIFPIQTLHENLAVPVRAVTFNSEGILASGHASGVVRIWEPSATEAQIIQAHNDAVYTLAFSPDGRWLITGSEDNTARIWDMANGAQVHVLRHSAPVRDVAFGPNGLTVATASESGNIRSWDMASGVETGVFELAGSRALGVAFSPDGRLLAGVGDDGRVYIWNFASGEQVITLGHHNTGEATRSVAFSPDGQWLASSSTDNTIIVWNAQSFLPVHTLDHGRDVYAVVFGPDNALLASAGRDNNIHVWDVQSGAEIATLTAHEGITYSVSFSPDGSELASAGGDGTVRLWGIQR